MLNCDTCDTRLDYENAVITQHPTRRNRETHTQCPQCALRELINIRPDLATQATNLLTRGYHIEQATT